MKRKLEKKTNRQNDKTRTKQQQNKTKNSLQTSFFSFCFVLFCFFIEFT